MIDDPKEQAWRNRALNAQASGWPGVYSTHGNEELCHPFAHGTALFMEDSDTAGDDDVGWYAWAWTVPGYDINSRRFENAEQAKTMLLAELDRRQESKARRDRGE